MISQTAEHALRAILYLAQQNDTPVSAGDVAQAIDAPANYLGKTLQTLARHGFVTALRGPKGGFRLAVDPARISISELVAVFSEAPRQRMCLLGGRPCSDAHACTAHERWSDMRSAVDEVLNETTVADLLGKSAGFAFISQSHNTARVAV